MHCSLGVLFRWPRQKEAIQYHVIQLKYARQGRKVAIFSSEWLVGFHLIGGTYIQVACNNTAPTKERACIFCVIGSHIAYENAHRASNQHTALYAALR